MASVEQGFGQYEPMKPAPPVMSARIPAIRLERTKQTWRLLRHQSRRATDTSEAIALPDRLPLPSDTRSDPDPARRPVREWESGSAPAFRFLGCATVAARRLSPRSAPQTNGRRDRDPAPEARERARRTARRYVEASRRREAVQPARNGRRALRIAACISSRRELMPGNSW